MPSISSLANKLQADFPHLTLTAGDAFRWLPAEKVVFFDHSSDNTAALLHEVAHAALEHTTYSRDIQLIEMEQQAWSYATTQLAPIYDATITDDQVQESLDSYRDWLHARSTCPACKATGLQCAHDQYKCLACHTTWRVNEARLCALRRYKV
jgi:predicted RecB family nuclease